MNVIIIGGGWAGLAAATELTRNKHNVVVYEAARQLGGRARAVSFDGVNIDNGQHILIGAYRAILDLLALYKVKEASVFRRLPLRLKLWRSPARRRTVELKAWPLPAPLHLAFGLLGMKGMRWRDKIGIIRALLHMRHTGFYLEEDQPLQAYLDYLKQSDDTIRCLWEPLCISILNTPIEHASTQLFLRVIRDSFFSSKLDSDLLLPVADLGKCLPAQATDYIERHGNSIRLGTRITRLHVDDYRVTGVDDGNHVTNADHVIVATAPEAAVQLLQTVPNTTRLCEKISKLESLPITTVYLKYPQAVNLPDDFIGTLDGHSQWFFDRGRLTNNQNMIAVVISGPGSHMAMEQEAFAEHIKNELSGYFPVWPEPESIKVIREKRATMNARAGVNDLRPGNDVHIDGLWLAGDYTNTGYPSTLESAVRSGIRCATMIMEKDKS